MSKDFWRALSRMSFKKCFLAYPVDHIVNIRPFDLWLGAYKWRTIPFFVLGLETILGISYSGSKRFDPLNYKRCWYQLCIAKFFQDRILTCGSIRPMHLPRSYDVLRLLIAFSSSMPLLCSPQGKLLDLNTTFIPSLQGLYDSIWIGIVLGRVSKRIENANLLPLINEIKASHINVSYDIAYLREMRYVACTLMNFNVVCKLNRTRVIVPIELDEELDVGSTGLFVIVKRRCKDAYPIISRIIEVIELSDLDSMTYIPMSLLSSTLMLASMLTPNSSAILDLIPYDTIMTVYKQIFEYIYPRIIHPAILGRYSCSPSSLLLRALDVMKELGIVIISNKKGKNVYWLKGSHVQQLMKLLVDTKVLEHYLELYIKRTELRILTARDRIKEYIRKGYFIAI